MKSLKLFLVVMLNLSVVTIYANGKKEMKIATEKELFEFAHLVNTGTLEATEIILENNIILTKPWTPVGNRNNPFQGRFNGKNHKIENVKIGTSENPDLSFAELGLFGHVGDKSEIFNLRLANVAIYSDRKHIAMGALAGRMSGDVINCNVEQVLIAGNNSKIGALTGSLEAGTINQCVASGKLSGTAGSLLGGIAGYAEKSSVTTSRSNVEIDGGVASRNGGLIGFLNMSKLLNSATDSNLSGEKLSNNGGLTGETYKSEIDGCYATGSVKGGFDSCSGGLTGMNGEAFLSNCFTEVKVEGKSYAGMVVGFNRNGELNSCYYNRTVGKEAGTKAGKSVKGKNQQEFKALLNSMNHSQYLGSTK
ncbi:MAG: hypothetical protein RR202_01320 [Bacteroidales bacterium]